MTVRKLFFRTAAVLVALLLIYVWIGIAYGNGWLQPWIYEAIG